MSALIGTYGIWLALGILALIEAIVIAVVAVRLRRQP